MGRRHDHLVIKVEESGAFREVVRVHTRRICWVQQRSGRVPPGIESQRVAHLRIEDAPHLDLLRLIQELAMDRHFERRGWSIAVAGPGYILISLSRVVQIQGGRQATCYRTCDSINDRVASSAANMCSTRSDASVMSSGVPNVVNMLNRAISP